MIKDYKSGTYIYQGTNKSFQPNYINKAWQLDDMELLKILGQADRDLGRLDMYSEYTHSVQELRKDKHYSIISLNILW